MTPDKFLIEPFSSAAVAAFRDKLRGHAYLPGDAAFPDAIMAWSLEMRHRPAIVVLPETADDVAHALDFARDHDLPVAVQATGHGVAIACTGGMLINTRLLQGVTIDPKRRTARVAAGVTWGGVITPAHGHDLAPLSGSSSAIGVVGYTLGGGHGWLARRYGRAAERIVSADLVTAKGERIHVSRESHPDLLWALRGGSGNFGIVTALEFELVPVSQIYGGATFYPIEQACHVFRAFNIWVRLLPESITASISIMRFPPLPIVPPPLQGAACVVVRACACENLASAEMIVAPMRHLATPLMDTFDTMPFTAIDAISMDPTAPMPVAARTVMLDSLGEATVDALLDVAGPGVDSPLLAAEFRYLGDTTAYAREEAGVKAPDASFVMYAVGITGTPGARAAMTTALEGITQALAPFTSDRVLLNFLGDGDAGDARTRAAFSEADFLRLQRVKAAYDPGNRFRFNHNILPMRIVVDPVVSRPSMPGRLA